MSARRVCAIAIGLAAACRAAPAPRQLPAPPTPAPINATSPTYRLTIAMSAETIQALTGSGFALIGMQAVAASDLAGQPLVWFATPHYSLTTEVSWPASYQAYTARRVTAPAVAIYAFAAYPIALGDTLTVDTAAGTGAVTPGGTAGAITIINATTAPFLCGIAQAQGGRAVPIVAFPLYGLGRQVIAPVERVLLTFATDRLVAGAPLTTAPGPGVIVELSIATARALRFDINLGWTADGAPWATPIAAGTTLAPLLILAP